MLKRSLLLNDVLSVNNGRKRNDVPSGNSILFQLYYKCFYSKLSDFYSVMRVFC